MNSPLPHVPEVFSPSSFPHFVTAEIPKQFDRIWHRLSQAGYWWDAKQRIAIANACREAKLRPVYDRERPKVSELEHDIVPGKISPLVIDTVERISTESGALDKSWCLSVCERMGEGAYAEIIAIVILALPIDRFCLYVGRPLAPWPVPEEGEPSRSYPEDMVDNGAWIRQTASAVANKELVNVSRAVSQCPIENDLRRELVDVLYMEGHSFFDKVWSRKSLSRTQLEVAATRTSVINQCFYCAHGHTMILDMAAKETGDKVNLESPQTGSAVNVGVEHGELILEYTELANREPDTAYAAYANLEQTLGERGAMELAAVVAIFNGLNRTSDPSGVPMEETLMAYGRIGNKTQVLGLDKMPGINNTQRPGLLPSVWILIKFQLRRLLGAGQ